jgi:hypothetical protein
MSKLGGLIPIGLRHQLALAMEAMGQHILVVAGAGDDRG